jgi:hypothetical protein
MHGFWVTEMWIDAIRLTRFCNALRSLRATLLLDQIDLREGIVDTVESKVFARLS